jgi:hypothetical protein
LRQSLDREQKVRIGEMVRKQLTRNSVENTKQGARSLIGSVKELAAATKLTEQVIYKLHSGDFSVRTLELVESVLGVDFQSQKVAETREAVKLVNNPGRDTDHWERAIPTRFGGYTRDQVEHYMGDYLSVRRSVTHPENYLGSLVTIFWDDEIRAARFSENNKFTASDGRKMDFSQSGTLHLSAQIGLVHLLTARFGAIRLVTLTRLQLAEPVMYGAMLTQVPEAGSYMPAKTTVHFRKITAESEARAKSLMGPIDVNNPFYFDVRRDLDAADEAIYTR